MDAATIIPWDVYVRTGDLDILAENFQMMERLVGWYRSQAVNNLTPEIKGFGDWLQPYAEDRKGDTPMPVLGAAYYAHSAQILADSAGVLGRTDEAVKYAAEAASIREAFAEHYFAADGRLVNTPETQTSSLLSIGFNLISAELQKKSVVHLVRLIGEAGGHLRTGFLGTPFIAKVLDRMGYSDLAFSLLFQETYPSWFYPINQGATTMWERWNSYSHTDGFGDAKMNSFNHYAYGAIGQWMVERIAGLAPDPAHPGYKHFFIQPVIGGPLTSAKAELETPYGKASSAWEKSDGRLVITAVIPPNATATVIFPYGKTSETVSAGAHRFELSLP
jgi:alpha-L-rhamnosidase